MNNSFRARGAESLSVGIGDDEVDPGQAGGDHIIDRVASGASYAAHHDAGLEFLQLGRFQIDRHILPHWLSLAAALPRRELVSSATAYPKALADKRFRLARADGRVRPEPSPLWLTSA